MMVKGQTCSTCAAFCPLDKSCRANPPVFTLLPTAPGKMTAAGVFPPAAADNWRGAWRPQPKEEESSG